MTSNLRRGALAAALAATTALSGCGQDDDTAAPAPATPSAAPTLDPVSAQRPSPGPATTYPVTVNNCGRDVTFAKAPSKVVTGWITGTELLLELGQKDRIAGIYNTSAFGKPQEAFAADYGSLKVLSEAAPTKEGLLAAAPDLIYADGNYLFDGKQLPTVAQLAARGTNVLVLSGFCDSGGSSTVLDVKADLTALGQALDVQGPAATLADQVDRRLAAVTPVTPAVPVAAVSVFDKTVYAYEGVYSDIIKRAGGTNLYTGTLAKGTYYGEVSVEDLTKKDPQTLLYLLSGNETRQAAKAYLDKAFPTLRAVQQDRVLYLPQEDSSNLRGVAGVEQVAEQLRALPSPS